MHSFPPCAATLALGTLLFFQGCTCSSQPQEASPPAQDGCARFTLDFDARPYEYDAAPPTPTDASTNPTTDASPDALPRRPLPASATAPPAQRAAPAAGRRVLRGHLRVPAAVQHRRAGRRRCGRRCDRRDRRGHCRRRERRGGPRRRRLGRGRGRRRRRRCGSSRAWRDVRGISAEASEWRVPVKRRPRVHEAVAHRDGAESNLDLGYHQARDDAEGHLPEDDPSDAERELQLAHGG